MLLRRSRSLPKVSSLCENQRDLLCGLFRLGSWGCTGGSTLSGWSLLGVARGRTTFCRGLGLGLGGCPQRLLPESAPMASRKRPLRKSGGTYKVVPEELHYQSRVLVALLAQGVKFYILISAMICLEIFHGCAYRRWRRQRTA